MIKAIRFVKFSLLALSLFVAVSASAQTKVQQNAGVTLVTVHSNSSDIRDVLYQVFTQAKKSFVLQPGVRFSLNLSLEELEFEEALQVILKAAGLKSEVQNGIYYISKGGHLAAEAQAEKGVLPKSVLDKKVTAKLSKTPIREVFRVFGMQSGIRFEVDPAVPSYRLDVKLAFQPLKVAIGQISKAAKLGYEFTDHKTIRIFKVETDDNSVSLSQ